MRNRLAQRLANCYPVARAMACSVTVAREIALRNKIPDARVLRRLKLMTTFGDRSLLLGFLPTTRCQTPAGTLSKLGYARPSAIGRQTFLSRAAWIVRQFLIRAAQGIELLAKCSKRNMNLYNVYFVSKGTGPRTVQIEALNSAGVKAQVESRYPGAYNIILNQLPSSAKRN